MGEIFIPEEVQNRANHLVESPYFKKYLGPVKQQMIDVAEGLRENDPSASVYRLANLELGAYLGAVNYILLFGEKRNGDRVDFKSVIFGVTDDGFGRITTSKRDGYMESMPGFIFESLDEDLDIMQEALSEGTKNAEYPDFTTSLWRTHKRISEVDSLREDSLMAGNGNHILRGLIQRVF